MEREGEIRRLRSGLAALRLMAGLAKLELKHREDQARVPKGEPGGGRFAKEHGAGGSHVPGFVAPIAAAARTMTTAEAAAAAGAGGAMAMAGALGGAMLGLTGDSRQPPAPVPQTSRKPGAPPPEPPPRGRFEEECDK